MIAIFYRHSKGVRFGEKASQVVNDLPGLALRRHVESLSKPRNFNKTLRGKLLSKKHSPSILYIYTTLTNFSTKYLVMCKVYTDVGGIN